MITIITYAAMEKLQINLPALLWLFPVLLDLAIIDWVGSK